MKKHVPVLLSAFALLTSGLFAGNVADCSDCKECAAGCCRAPAATAEPKASVQEGAASQSPDNAKPAEKSVNDC